MNTLSRVGLSLRLFIATIAIVIIYHLPFTGMYLSLDLSTLYVPLHVYTSLYNVVA